MSDVLPATGTGLGAGAAPVARLVQQALTDARKALWIALMCFLVARPRHACCTYPGTHHGGCRRSLARAFILCYNLSQKRQAAQEAMPKAKRERRERTDNYHLIKQWCRTPEQRLYEGIRPVVLFGLTTSERAAETGLAEHTLRRAADAFDRQGLLSLFRPTKEERESHPRSLPIMMRQLIVDLKTAYPDFTQGEIATLCAINFDGRRHSHHSVQAVLADGPRPSRMTRQFPTYAEMADPEERRLAIIRLHAQGWAIATIARYLDVSRSTV